MSIPEIKARIRRDILQQRRQLSRSFQQYANDAVCCRIQKLSCYQKARTIALYFSVNHEIDLTSLWQNPLPNKIFCFPIVTSNHSLLFAPYTTPTIKNRWGIPEPDISCVSPVDETNIHIVFVPLVAFDLQGHRLGMGGGYYDRFFEKNDSALRIGIAYECQKQNKIPIESWDQPLHAVITESSLYWFSKKNLL